MTGPLTVAYLGNFTKPWCTEVHVTASLETLGHRVVRLQENETDWATIPATVDALGAQLLIWQRTWPAETDVVLPELARLREMGVPSCSYHLDRWFGLDREHQVDEQPFFRTDLVVSPDDSPRWAEHGVNHLWMPPGVYDAECERVAGNRRRWPHDVVFVGSYPYPHPEWADYRAGLIAAFRTEFGQRFKVLPRRGHPIRGRDLQELYATVPVILGDSCLAGETHRYISDRIPETVGRGGFLIHPHVAGVTDGPVYTAGEHLATYTLGDFDQAIAIAHQYLDDREERSHVTTAGRAHVAAHHTYLIRMSQLLAELCCRGLLQLSAD